MMSFLKRLLIFVPFLRRWDYYILYGGEERACRWTGRVQRLCWVGIFDDGTRHMEWRDISGVKWRRDLDPEKAQEQIRLARARNKSKDGRR